MLHTARFQLYDMTFWEDKTGDTKKIEGSGEGGRDEVGHMGFLRQQSCSVWYVA